ncbi:MAG: phage tail protein [Desulfobaccales bacterium]
MSGLMADSAAGTSGRTAAKTSTLQASYRVTTAVEGLAIPLFYGRNRLQPNIFFAWGWQPVAQAQPSQSMGKGGSQPAGGTQYVYTQWVLFGLCEGPVTAIGRNWNDKTRQYTFSAAGLAPGSRPQPPVPELLSGAPAQALGYYGTAFYHGNIDLGSGNSMPNVSFECYGPLPYIVATPVTGESQMLPPAATATESYTLPYTNPGGGPIIPVTVANAAAFISDSGVIWDNVDANGNLAQVSMTKVSGTPAASGQYAEAGGVYTFYAGTPDLSPDSPGYFPPDSGNVVISYTYVPAPAFQVVAQCLGTCTEEYTLPDDNPLQVVNDDLWTGDAGVTLAGAPLIPIPYAQPNPLYPPVVAQGYYTCFNGSYWFSPLDASQNPGDLVITYYYATPAGATISPSGCVWTADNGVTYDDGTPLTKVSGTPAAAGQYNVTAGAYTFSGWDCGRTVVLNYTYSTLLDSNPAEFLVDLLTNPDYGCGFDPSQIGDMTQFSNYCLANDFLLSPVLDEQQEAREQIADILKLLNTQVVWCEDRLHFIPLGDQVVSSAKTGVTFTPDLTPVLDLTEDDFLEDDNNDPIQITRNPQVDAYNQVQVEYLDRYADYNTTIVVVNNQAAQDVYGLRPQDVTMAHAITDPDVAVAVAANILQYCLYARNSYQFKLGLLANILEPGDWITLTSPRLGLNQMPVRVTEISEDDQCTSTVTALEWPIGTAQAPVYPSQNRTPPVPNYNAPPGDCNPPVIFEPPLGLSDTLSVWVAVSGGPNWGGCQVWASWDGSNYQQIGTVTSPARTGFLVNPLPAAPDPDTTDVAQVNLTECGGVLLSASLAEVNALVTLCYLAGSTGVPPVAPEFIAYENAALVSASIYDLSYLRRNCYGYGTGASGSPMGIAHAAGERFARVDGSVFQMPFSVNQIAQTIYLKFLSYNQVGAAGQSLADVEAYPYQIQGSALTSPLPDITGLVSVYLGSQQYLQWTAITPAQDPRYSGIDYEIRVGAIWATAQILTYVSDPDFLVTQAGTYWVSASYASNGVILAYSAVPAQIEVEAVAITVNDVVSVDEASEGWPGILTAAQVSSGTVVLALGQAVGSYAIPASEIPDLGTAQAGALGASVAFNNVVPGASFDAAPDVDAIPDVDQYDAGAGGEFDSVPDVDAAPDFDQAGGALAQTVQIQVQFSQDGSTWGAWQNFTPGTYVFRMVNFQVLLTQVVQGGVTLSPVVTDFAWSISMPDRLVDVGSIACPATGLAVTFTPAFQITPSVAVTILNAEAGDVVTFPTALGPAGGTIMVTNGGTGVARNISYIAKGY